MGNFDVPKYDGRTDPSNCLSRPEKILKAKKFEKENWHIVASLRLKKQSQRLVRINRLKIREIENNFLLF